MAKLTALAKQRLRDENITQAAWARYAGWEDGTWRGDECGCDDDRCIGFHHYGNEDCGCIEVLIEQWHRDAEAPRIWAAYLAAVDAGDTTAAAEVQAEAWTWTQRYFPQATSAALDIECRGRRGITITYPLRGKAVSEWADAAGSDEYRLCAWTAPAV